MFTAREKVLFGLLGLILVLSVLNLFLTQSLRQANKQPVPAAGKQSPSPQENKAGSDLFSSQTAIVKGKITGVSESKMAVENDKGVKGDLKTGKILLLNSSEGIKVATNSTDLKQVRLNQSATITLVLVGDEYLVSSVTY